MGQKRSCCDLCQRLFYVFSKSFIVSHLTFKSLIQFEFLFVHGVRKCSNFILWRVVIQFSQHHLLKRLYFLLVYSCLCQRLHIYNGILLSQKNEQIWVFCSDVDGLRVCHTEWSNSKREKQRLQTNTYVCDLVAKSCPTLVTPWTVACLGLCP